MPFSPQGHGPGGEDTIHHLFRAAGMAGKFPACLAVRQGNHERVKGFVPRVFLVQFRQPAEIKLHPAHLLRRGQRPQGFQFGRIRPHLERAALKRRQIERGDHVLPQFPLRRIIAQQHLAVSKIRLSKPGFQRFQRHMEVTQAVEQIKDFLAPRHPAGVPARFAGGPGPHAVAEVHRKPLIQLQVFGRDVLFAREVDAVRSHLDIIAGFLPGAGALPIGAPVVGR